MLVLRYRPHAAAESRCTSAAVIHCCSNAATSGFRRVLQPRLLHKCCCSLLLRHRQRAAAKSCCTSAAAIGCCANAATSAFGHILQPRLLHTSAAAVCCYVIVRVLQLEAAAQALLRPAAAPMPLPAASAMCCCRCCCTSAAAVCCCAIVIPYNITTSPHTASCSRLEVESVGCSPRTASVQQQAGRAMYLVVESVADAQQACNSDSQAAPYLHASRW